jgi:hypothetical protein
MGVPTSEFGYTSATTGMEDHEVHKGRGGIGKNILLEWAFCKIVKLSLHDMEA